MLRAWWHNLLTNLTVCELADLRHSGKSFAYACASLGLKSCRRLQLQQLHVRLDAPIEVIESGVGPTGDMLGNGRVKAFQKIGALACLPSYSLQLF